MQRIARFIVPLAVAIVLATAAAPAARAQANLPPHAWLFGAWTGGLFPPPSTLNAQECLALPAVIFTRDIVMRVTITEQTYAQRLVETARATGNGMEFRFSRMPQVATGPFGASAGGGETGFGCENPDVLHVQKRGENEISFPGCADFPYPLVRCPSH